MQRTPKEKTIGRIYKYALKSGDSAEKGQTAFFNTASNLVEVWSAATTLIPFGYFYRDLDGDGTTKVEVHVFEEHALHGFTNSGTAPVQADGLFRPVYFEASDIVRDNDLGSTLSAAGVALAIDTDGTVWVIPKLIAS